MLLLALLLCVVSVVNGSLDGRIVGGNDATEGKYVYQVSIRYGSSHICGGSIINSRHVLTAAHCIYLRNTKLLRVVAGTNYLNKGGVTYSADALIWPINYDSFKFIHDIGLIRVDRHIEFNSRIRPVILPSAYYVPEGETAIVTGWGRLNATDNVPVTLQELPVVVISQTLCEQYYWELWKNNICTFTKKDEGVCYGDSGGPLILNGVQIGIVSYGRPCGTGSPDVYTRVYPYLDWIKIISDSATNECKNNTDVEVNATNHVHLNIWTVLSLAILTLVSYVKYSFPGSL